MIFKTRISPNWGRFLYSSKRDLLLIAFTAATLTAYRAVMAIVFRARMSESSTWQDVSIAFLNGLRFDATVGAYVAAIPLSVSIISGFFDTGRASERIRIWAGMSFIALSSFLFTITLGFFGEFDDQFNEIFFGIYYDDTWAVLKTMWREYHMVLDFALAGAFGYGASRLLRRILKMGRMQDTPLITGTSLLKRIAAVLVIAVLFVIALRGSIGHRPIQRKDASVSRDEFLNKIIPNPYIALKYALQDHFKLINTGGLKVYLPDENIVSAAKLIFSTSESYQSLDQYMLKSASGPKGIQPNHVFLIVMESYSAWPLMDKYRPLGIADSLSLLAERGLFIWRFLPSGTYTMPSLSAIVPGLPDSKVMTNYQVTALKPYPSSIAESFKRLGYRTRVFYGGYLSWQKAGDFFQAQGFEEVYGASHFAKWGTLNEWGAEDELLFDFTADSVDDGVKSFNLVITTTNHNPYKLDVYSKGFQLRDLPQSISPMSDASANIIKFGHFWYADRELGRFVSKAENKLHNALFAITGDHYGRSFINARPGLYESNSVPFVLYGKDVLNGVALPEDASGSHIDIAPTLIELSAPKGFQYYAMGRDMLDKNIKHTGIGSNIVIGGDFIADLRTMEVQPLLGNSPSLDKTGLREVKKLHDALHGIGWWRVVKGDRFMKVAQ